MNNLLLDLVKEQGVVAIINDYKSQLELEMNKTVSNVIEELLKNVKAEILKKKLLTDDFECKKFILLNIIIKVLLEENKPINNENIEYHLTKQKINQITDKQVKNFKKTLMPMTMIIK